MFFWFICREVFWNSFYGFLVWEFLELVVLDFFVSIVWEFYFCWSSCGGFVFGNGWVVMVFYFELIVMGFFWYWGEWWLDLWYEISWRSGFSCVENWFGCLYLCGDERYGGDECFLFCWWRFFDCILVWFFWYLNRIWMFVCLI